MKAKYGRKPRLPAVRDETGGVFIRLEKRRIELRFSLDWKRMRRLYVGIRRNDGL